MSNIRVLIIDDELVICKSCEKIIRRAGHEAKYALNGRDGMRMIGEEEFDVVFIDLKMPDIGGMEVLRNVKQRHPDIIAIIITGYATIASAVETMKLGAFDYLPKPFTAQEFRVALDNAIEKRTILLENKALSENAEPVAEFEGLIGKSQPMQEVFSLITKVAGSDSTVLILGESGTGKELVAAAIHRRSGRRDRKFVALDCGTLSPELLESELFGHVKGAFTGAVVTKLGLFEVADKGTLFLDEIANTSAGVQGKLLRVLQEREFLPVGGVATRKVDVRLICASNRDLKTLSANGEFREDLFYRLSVFPIQLPPLRERKEDIPALAYHFLDKYNKRAGKSINRLAPKVLEMLLDYEWPGNVRELENVIERLVIITEGDAIDPRNLPNGLYSEVIDIGISIPRKSNDLKILKKKLRQKAVEDLEKRFVLQALRRSQWNVTRASEDVEMQRPNFQALMRKYNVRLKDLRTSPDADEESGV
jgi:DNA-binding NtrC family response regulator